MYVIFSYPLDLVLTKSIAMINCRWYTIHLAKRKEKKQCCSQWLHQEKSPQIFSDVIVRNAATHDAERDVLTALSASMVEVASYYGNCVIALPS